MNKYYCYVDETGQDTKGEKYKKDRAVFDLVIQRLSWLSLSLAGSAHTVRFQALSLYNI